MKNVKSNMTRDFDAKLRMADGGMVGAIQGLRGARERAIDDAVNGPKKPAAAAPAKPAPAAEPDDSAIGIVIPKHVKEAPAKPAPTVMERLRSAIGLADGGFIDDGEDPETVRGVPADPKTFAAGGAVQGPGTGTSDSIPAMLSKGEFVMPADSVKAIGKHKLEALRHATHTPVRMADGGDPADYLKRTNPYSGYVQQTNANAQAGSSFGPEQTAAPAAPAPTTPVTPATGDFSDARDLRVANMKNGMYDRAQAASNAMDDALSTAMNPNGPPDTGGQIRSIGTTFYGSGSQPIEDTIGAANANARAEMQRMDAAKDAGFANAREGLFNASMQNQARYDAEQRDNAFQNALRDPHMTKSAKQRLLAARSQDIQHESNVFGKAVTMRGQDIGAQTAARGQDIAAQTAANEQGVQTRGQNLTAYSNYALRNLQAAQFGRQIAQQDRQFNFEQGKEQRAARQEGLTNLNAELQRAATTTGSDGKPVVDFDKLNNMQQKINYTAQQMGLHPGDLTPDQHTELVRRAKAQVDEENASKGITGAARKFVTGRGVKATDDLRRVSIAGFEPGAVFDNVKTGAGETSPEAYTRGKYGLMPDFQKLPNIEREQELDDVVKKLRSPR